MVRKKRIGNDLVVRWRIKNKPTGEAYDLEGRNLRLTMTCSEMVIIVDDYAINGNTIEYSFLGRKQKYTGLYVLTLVEERGREGLLTLDTKEAFQLVPHSWQENEESDDGALGIETIDLVSEINGGVPGESAYKTACRHGFVGTEQEWLTSLEAKVTRPSIENALGYMPYERPESGIPSTDLAQGVIPDVSNFITKSVDDLTNYYLKEDTYTKAEVAALIRAIQQFHYEVAANTSDVTKPQSNVLYLIGPTGSGADKYEEYVYPDVETGWVKIGDTSIDLSGYVTTSTLNTALADYTTTADLTTLLAAKYEKPSSGIPESDLSSAVASKINIWAKGSGDGSAVLGGSSSSAAGAHSVAEGYKTVANGDNSHAEGKETQSSGLYSHSEGAASEAAGVYSHAEGNASYARGSASHTEGFNCAAESYTSNTKSAGSITTHAAYSHAEGNASVAAGLASHSEGKKTFAQGNSSHAEGNYTEAKNESEHAQGQYNKSNKANATFGNAGNTIHSVGIGTGTNDRKNAIEVMQNGDIYIIGIGGYDGTNPSSASSLQDILRRVESSLPA